MNLEEHFNSLSKKIPLNSFMIKFLKTFYYYIILNVLQYLISDIHENYPINILEKIEDLLNQSNKQIIKQSLNNN